MLYLSHKLISIIGNQTKILSTRQAVAFPSNKILSPGIRQMCFKDMEEFLRVSANEVCKVPNTSDTIHASEIISQELKALAYLVEEGSRVCETQMRHFEDRTEIRLVLRNPDHIQISKL